MKGEGFGKFKINGISFSISESKSNASVATIISFSSCTVLLMVSALYLPKAFILVLSAILLFSSYCKNHPWVIPPTPAILSHYLKNTIWKSCIGLIKS